MTNHQSNDYRQQRGSHRIFDILEEKSDKNAKNMDHLEAKINEILTILKTSHIK